MVGGAISGYCATGSRTKLTPPTITKMIDTTEAKIGRSMKKWEMRIGASPQFGLVVEGPAAEAGRAAGASCTLTFWPGRACI